MKKLSFEISTSLKFSAPVTEHHFLLRTIPISQGVQTILSSTLELKPNIPYTSFYDSFGNLNEVGCITVPHDEFTYSISGVAEINLDNQLQETLHPIYKYPSFYTQLSPEMISYVSSLNLKGNVLEKSLQLADTLFHDMAYQSGSTCTTTTAMEAFRTKQGVCQDYAHIFIALARYLGIPTRYANGLPLGEGPSHAWIEIYNYNHWIGIDPTHNRLTGEDYVRFCVGRDFHDCALERGTFLGTVYQNQEITGHVIEQ